MLFYIGKIIQYFLAQITFNVLKNKNKNFFKNGNFILIQL